uniref:Actin interacting protein 3-like C-terminal domain-containing protein n=1 Tax=Acrobeloides nanus TaxID=290746 RepID=A0A914BZE6_9BILA
MFSRILSGKRNSSRGSASVPNSPKPQHNTGMKRLDSWIGHLLRDGVGSSSKPPVCNVTPNRPPSVVINNPSTTPIVAPSSNIIGPNVVPAPVSRTQTWNGTHGTIPERYDDNVRVNMAPLAFDELEERSAPPAPPKPARFSNAPPLYQSNNVFVPASSQPQNHYQQRYTAPPTQHKENRANILLQQLRAEDGAQSESDASANEPTLHLPPKQQQAQRSLGVIFLQFNDEVKRSSLPTNLHSIEQVKGLFLRSFPNLSHAYLNLPNVKIYIQETSKSQLFYELDDLNDIKDRSVLKIREQNLGCQSPPPIRFTDHPPVSDYLSEPEIDDHRTRSHRYNLSYRMRPASAVPGESGRMYNPTNSLTKTSRSPLSTIPSGRFDSYYDPYYSDTSSQGPRSGSVTPVIDKETKFRMDTMERQLAGLSSLVHSALVSKGMSESTQREILDLRRQILEFHPEVERLSTHIQESNSSGLESSTTSSVQLNSESQQELLRIKRAVQTTQVELKQIRRNAQMNVQTSRDIIKEAFDKIQKYVQEHFDGTTPAQPTIPWKNEDESLEKLRSEHLSQINALQNSLQTFENEVESIRRSVLNSNRKLRMVEVEQLTNNLTQIGRNAARLKTQFPPLQTELELRIRKDMERVVKEEKFIKDETQQIDQSLRRCKTLANMMVTMKKLAMVQDPVISSHQHRNSSKPPISAKPTGLATSIRSEAATSSKSINNNDRTDNLDNVVPSPLTPSPPTSHVETNGNYKANEKSDSIQQQSRVLDSILDELNTTTSKMKKPSADASTTLTCKVPPRPPERCSSVELRKKYSASDVQQIKERLPPQPIQQTNVIENGEMNRPGVASSTESINSQEGEAFKIVMNRGNITQDFP